MLVPQMWQDALIDACRHNLEASQPFAEMMKQWDEEEAKRMAEDPEYAKQVEEFDRQWIEENQRWAEERDWSLW